MAFRPAGVAAQPSPRILLIILAAIYSSALCPFGTDGNKKARTGRSALVRASMIPAFFAIFISPVHIDMIPNMVIQSVTASFDESSAAVPTSPVFPVNAATIIPANSIIPQSLFSISAPRFLLGLSSISYEQTKNLCIVPY